MIRTLLQERSDHHTMERLASLRIAKRRCQLPGPIGICNASTASLKAPAGRKDIARQKPSLLENPRLSRWQLSVGRKIQQSSGVQRYASTSAPSAAPLARTGLYDLHLANGATMVPFAGYSMPVQYSDLSVGESHKWTREKASLFDVGHMYYSSPMSIELSLIVTHRVQHRLSGALASSLLEKVTPTSLKSLALDHSTLSCLLHPRTGGIVDDTVITRLRSDPDLFYLVTNAACRDKDLHYLASQITDHSKDSASKSERIDWQVLDGWGLIALQGPLSVDILQKLMARPQELNLNSLYFGQCAFVSFLLPSGEHSEPVLVSRGGYTGEDGFEISLPPTITAPITKSLLAIAGPEKLRLAGLGARDSLRLEAGMCLYGHDLDDTTTPVEASLRWVIGNDRRASGGFHGDQVIIQQLKPAKEGGIGIVRRRVGLIVHGAPAREGAEIVVETAEGRKVIGKVTSGCPSPTLGKNIAMGYVKEGFHKAGTEVAVLVRGKGRKAEVVKMPFVQSRYWKQAPGIAPG